MSKKQRGMSSSTLLSLVFGIIDHKIVRSLIFDVAVREGHCCTLSNHVEDIIRHGQSEGVAKGGPVRRSEN